TRECVIDTLSVNGAVEFSKDLDGAFTERLIEREPGRYPHLTIPGAFDAAIVDTEEFGAWANSLHAWDVVVRDLAFQVDRSVKDHAGLYATLQGAPGATTKTNKQRYAVAKAIFDAMTRAKEVTTEHHVPPGRYDESWTRVRRASANDRVVCTSVTYTDRADT